MIIYEIHVHVTYSFCHLVELYERDANGMKVIYWDVAYPFPMSHRDVSF